MQAEDKAREHVEGLTLEQLIDSFEVSEKQFEKASSEEAVNLATTRGWLLVELERRDVTAFEAWLDTEDCSVEDLRRLFGGDES